MTDRILKTAIAFLIITAFAGCDSYSEADYREDLITIYCKNQLRCNEYLDDSLSECIAQHKKMEKDSKTGDYLPVCSTYFDFMPDEAEAYINCLDRLRKTGCLYSEEYNYCEEKTGGPCEFTYILCGSNADCPDPSFCYPARGECVDHAHDCENSVDCDAPGAECIQGACKNVEVGDPCEVYDTLFCDNETARLLRCDSYDKWELKEDCGAQGKKCIARKCVAEDEVPVKMMEKSAISIFE